jgi:transcriptional regulator with XRE-family HTH domain
MKPYEKPRHAASQALIELRTAMGLNQAEFAIKVLGSAVTTMSRYETTHPPSGEVLLRLAEIARAERDRPENVHLKMAFGFLASRFQALFADELFNSVPGEKLITELASKDREEHGYLFMKIEGGEGMRAASAFLSLIPALKSKDDKTRDEAVRIADRLVAAVDKMNGNPAAKELRDAFHPRPARKKSRKG